MSEEILISSYFPLYRSPPHPALALNWACADDRKTGVTLDPSIEFEPPKNYSTCNGRTVIHILHRYIESHPESLLFDNDAWLKAYATQRLLLLSRCWPFHSSVLHKIFSGCVVDFPAGPDDLLDFNYMQISVRVNVAELAKLLLRNRLQLRLFLEDRYKDKRYKFFHHPEYKKVNYWLDPDNWMGFKAGILVDYCMSCVLYRSGRSVCYRYPVEMNPESGLYEAVKIDPVILDLFNNDRSFVTWVAKLFMGLKSRPYYWQLYDMQLDKGIDSFITYSINKRRKELEEHVQPETTEGQSGEILQDEQAAIRRLVQEGAIQEIRVPAEPVPDTAAAPVTIGTPVVAGQGIQFVHDNDGDTIGYTRVDTGGTQGVARATELATEIAERVENGVFLDHLMPGARAAFFEGLRLWREAGQPEIRDVEGNIYPGVEDAIMGNHPILRPAPGGHFLAHTAAEWTLQEINNAVATGRATEAEPDTYAPEIARGILMPRIVEPPAEVHGIRVFPLDDEDGF